MLSTAVKSSIKPKERFTFSILPPMSSFTFGWGRFGFRYSVVCISESGISAFFVWKRSINW